MEMSDKLAFFESKQIRRRWYENEWWFVIVDVIGALTNSQRASAYWTAMKARVKSEDGFQLSTFCRQLKFASTDGKKYERECANTEGLFRIIQSIPSPKAEPFKLWLAKVGYERVQEIENPELAQERMKMLYEQKGYPKGWIEKRLRGIAIREGLTDEWQNRGIESQSDFAILTAEISKATFGMTPSQYREYKNIPKQSKENLRDSMTDLEFIFTMLGERVTTEISQEEKPEGMPENKKVAQRGGRVAGKARTETEKELGKSVISKKGVLEDSEPLLLIEDTEA